MTKRIRLCGRREKFALVSDEDYEVLSKYKWYYRKSKGIHDGYAYMMVPMHRMVLGIGDFDERHTDHRNGDSLDNQRDNLRIATSEQNARNRSKIVRKATPSSSRYKGVRYHRKTYNLRKRWQAQIYVNGRNISLGYYLTENEAAQAYNEAAILHYGEFAHLNKVGGEENRVAP